MSGLQALVETALLGTERGILPTPMDESTLSQLLMQLADLTPEDRLLSSAGAIALYEQNGRLPQRLRSVPGYPDATPPAWPPCSQAAGRYLALMLDSVWSDVLPEFLRALALSKQSVPPQYLPTLLERAEKAPAQRSLVRPVLGRAGQWIASQNPAWAYATAEAKDWAWLTTQWQRSSATARQSLLRYVRQEDAERGRQLLESTWKSETPSHRAWLIGMLETGLSMADEPFLEAALDDRNYTVRKRAAELLARLPASRLCQRMTANTADLLSWSPGESGLTVHFPQEFSPQMMRDGVVNHTATARVRSQQLIQMIGAVPLAHWEAKWQATPDAIIAAVQASRWPTTLLRAVAIAAERQCNIPWADALLALSSTLETNVANYVLKLVEILPPEHLYSFVSHVSTQTDADQLLDKERLLVRTLRRWPHNWDTEVACVWLGHFRRHLHLLRTLPADAHPTSVDSVIRTQAKQFARCCPVDMVPEIEAQIAPYLADETSWQPYVREMLTTLRFRQGMLAALSQPNP